MKTNFAHKVFILSLTLFSFFYSAQSNAQCTLQVFANLINDECQSGSNGAVTAVGIFGTPPYTAVWRNSIGTLIQTDPGLAQGQATNASGLPADIYTVTFTDATGSCIRNGNISVGNITIDTSTTTNSGTISSNATGVTYQWVDCNNGMSAISGETNSSYTPTSVGDYAVRLTKNTCVDTSACVPITTLGINETSFSNTFKVYPNPTYGNFAIEFDNTHKNLTAVLYSLTGQIVQKQHAENASLIQLNINKPTGIYILKIISSNGESAYLKVIKK